MESDITSQACQPRASGAMVTAASQATMVRMSWAPARVTLRAIAAAGWRPAVGLTPGLPR
jgi:hypothetical protein